MTLQPPPTIDLSELEALVPGPAQPAAEVHGDGAFASAFDVDGVMRTAAAAANAAFGVGRLQLERLVALGVGPVSLDGEAIPTWADLSGYYDTADGGHIQFHCNFPHHAAGVVDELGCEPIREAVQAAVLERDPAQLEAALIGRGLVAARLRTLDEWDAHPHAAATIDLPVISVERIGDAPPRPVDRRRRVLDCSRVLAGPVASMTFAAHGADVLRVGSRHLPSVELCVLLTGSGKRNTNVELGTSVGDQNFRSLLNDADVWVDAYRPGAFEGHGFGLDAVPPGSVTVQLSAFDWVGPWAGRRGYDSIVQSTTGIVRAGAEAASVDAPTPLPVQALDYATGLLAAFAAERLVQHQADVGGTWLARLSLLRTRNWLVGRREPTPFTPAKPVVDPVAMRSIETPLGLLESPGPLSGSWPHGPQPLGTSEPVWLSS